jgi:hypothetical protein
VRNVDAGENMRASGANMRASGANIRACGPNIRFCGVKMRYGENIRFCGAKMRLSWTGLVVVFMERNCAAEARWRTSGDRVHFAVRAPYSPPGRGPRPRGVGPLGAAG